MKNETRKAYDAYTNQVATLNGVSADAVSKRYTATPSVQQKLEDRIRISSDFLGKINVVGVDEMAGETIGLGVSGPIAGRTDTSGEGTRKTSDVLSLNAAGYQCKQTDFDTHLGYAKLDMWAKFPDFQVRLTNAILNQMALDRIMIGFNGVSAEATTNKVANPLLQDVNKGWLQQIREYAPAHWMKEVKAASGVIKIGDAVAQADGYKNLDALVFDLVNELIHPTLQEHPDLVVICGRQLLADKYFPILNQAQPASEKVASDVVISQKRIGGLPAVRVPFFPANAVLVTTLDNLSIYYQNGARRRSVKEVPERNRIETYESSNDAYVVESADAVAFAENIQLV